MSQQEDPKTIPFSPYARWWNQLLGYELYLKNELIDKWEVYAMGLQNTEKIILGLTKVKAIKID